MQVCEKGEMVKWSLVRADRKKQAGRERGRVRRVKFS